MRTPEASNTAPWTAVATALSAILLGAATAAAQTMPPGPPAEDQVGIPDSRNWTVEQAVVNLRSSDKGARLAALSRLAREPGPSIQKWIAEAAQYDPEPRIRYEAVQILARRKESESLPVLIFIAEKDTDDRVRAAARTVVQAAGVPVGNAPPQPAPGQPAPAPGAGQPDQARPAPAPVYDEKGNELPPGYLDGQATGPGAAAEFDSPLGRPTIDEETVDTGEEETVHRGFLPSLGYDGAIGSPRDTLARNRIGLDIGLAASGIFNTVVSGDLAGEDITGLNDFEALDFSLTLEGTWAPWDFLELGLALEVLTVEKLDHLQAWEWASGTSEGEYIDADTLPETTRLYNDASYSGAALGFLSLDLKTLLYRSELLRAGLAVRVTFPTHTGERFESGIGAPVLFLPTSSNSARREYRTLDGKLWGVEPGIVFSVAPVPHLTLYGDLAFAMTFLSYTRYSEELVDSQVREFSNDLRATGLFLVPNLGAQYRLLDEALGIQLAVQPAIYLGTAVDGSLASFGIVPGVSYTLLEHLELSLTANIETAADAPRPFLCTDLTPTEDASAQPCGVGRRFGMDLGVSWVF